jgi:hypothetical protein
MARDFYFLNCPHWLLGPPCFPFNGHWVHFLGLKWPEREDDHSLPSSVKVKNGAICLLPYMLSWRGQGALQFTMRVCKYRFYAPLFACNLNISYRLHV